MEHIPSFRDDLYTDIQPSYNDSLAHHGIKGMHWGVRRYQNPDGSLTFKGKQRYSNSSNAKHQKTSSLATNKEAILDGRKIMKKELVSVDEVDDDELIDVVAYDVANYIAPTYKKNPSKQDVSDLSDSIADDFRRNT